MFVFAHIHKCAGTSVVQAAMRGGLRLLNGHANGAPVRADGSNIDDFSSMTPDEASDFFRSAANAGVDFLALEWDFPRLDVLMKQGLVFFTILRDPLERAHSNMKMDARFGWGNRFSDLRSYMDGSASYRSHNYICKYLSGAMWVEMPSSDRLSLALRNISYMKYCFVDDDIRSFLQDEVQMPISDLRRENAGGENEDFLISEADQSWFRKENALDYVLIDFLRSSRRILRKSKY